MDSKQYILKNHIDIYPLAFTLGLFALQLYACSHIPHVWQAMVFGIICIFLLGTNAAFNHHHQHHPIFKSSILNRSIELIFGLQTGITAYMWVIHHNIGHHKYYLNQEKDTARWLMDGVILKKSKFALYHFIYGFKQIKEFGKEYPMLYKKYQWGRVIYYMAIMLLFYLYGLNYFFYYFAAFFNSRLLHN